MIKKLAASLALCAVSMGASAADLPRRTQPAAFAPAAPAFTWTGAYVGAHAGYSFGRTRSVEGAEVLESGAKTDGVAGGVLAGYNWQRGALVYGLEGDISAANLNGTGSNQQSIFAPNRYRSNALGNVRARIGYAILPQTLLFVAGGAAFANYRFTSGDQPSGIAPPQGVPPKAAAAPDRNLHTGWTIGAGLDHAVTANLVGRVEYLYSDLGKKTYVTGDSEAYQITFKAQTVRAALIYKF